MSNEDQTPELDQSDPKPEDKPAISLNDLADVVTLIDTAIERGAYRGKEIGAVARIRDKFDSVIEPYRNQQPTK